MFKSAACLTFLTVWLIIGWSIDELFLIAGDEEYQVGGGNIAGFRYEISADLTYKSESYEVETKDVLTTIIPLLSNTKVKTNGEDDDTYRKGYKSICNGGSLFGTFQDLTNQLEKQCKALKSIRNNGVYFAIILSGAVALFFISALLCWLAYFGKCTKKCSKFANIKLVVGILIFVASLLLIGGTYLIVDDYNNNVIDASYILVLNTVENEGSTLDDALVSGSLGNLITPTSLISFRQSDIDFGYTAYIVFIQMILASIAGCIISNEDNIRKKTKQEQQLEMYTGNRN